jgi:pyruvate dehydrogenase E2 component (dihydrolipoamide acetyltransferase)
MPSLGADMQAGTLVAWRKAPGERVRRGEIIAEVETEKGLIEVECFSEGVVERQLVEPGTKVPVGTPLAMIADGAPGSPQVESAPLQLEPSPPAVQAIAARVTPAARRMLRELDVAPEQVHGTGSHGAITRADVLAARIPVTHVVVTATQQQAPGTHRLRVSPRARRLARMRGVPLEGIPPSGPQGSIVARDVEKATSSPIGKAPDGQARMRATIAAAMARSKREIPHYYLSHTVDLGRVVPWLERENERRPMAERLLLAVLFVRAVALAVREVPELNAHYHGDVAAPLPDVNVGVAVSLRGGGLLAPAIMHADHLSLDELGRAFKDVVNRARAGRLTSSEMGSGTITITSLGERGVETVFPVIIPPQVAMVGFGAVRQRPMVVESAVVARPTVTVSLAADHRVSDGHRGGLFLSTVATLLEEPPSP